MIPCLPCLKVGCSVKAANGVVLNFILASAKDHNKLVT